MTDFKEDFSGDTKDLLIHSLKTEFTIVGEEPLLMQNYTNYVKELVRKECIKEEPNDCDENDNTSTMISRYEREQCLTPEISTLEKRCWADDSNIELKSMLVHEDCKLKDLVPVVQISPLSNILKEKIMSMKSVKLEVDLHNPEMNIEFPLPPESQLKEEGDKYDVSNDIFQEEVNTDTLSLSNQYSYPHRKKQKNNIFLQKEVSTDISVSTKRKSIVIRSRDKEQIIENFNSRETFYCEHCSRSFIHKFHLSRHMKNHLNKHPYTCSVCGLQFSRTDSLRRHNLIHFPIKAVHKEQTESKFSNKHFNYKLQCDVCNKIFQSYCDLRRHSVVHGDKATCLCERCGKTYTQLGDLHRHLAVHTGQDLQQCDTCGKSFNRRMSLLRHQVIHNKDKLLFCDFCGRGFTRKDCLQSHMLQHMPQKPNVCKVCGKSYKLSAYLKSHMYTHLGGNLFNCQLCDKEFATDACLRQHLRIHTSKKSPKNGHVNTSISNDKPKQKCLKNNRNKLYDCDICNQTFLSLHYLRQHYSIHNRSYRCDHCEKCFKRKVYLKRHILVHLN